MAVQIYGLIDPLTNELRYVGKTHSSLRRRFDSHLSNARKGVRQPSACWIRSLLKKERRPEIFVIEECAESDWEEAEQFWIAYFRSLGARLLNLSIGGGAGALGYRATPETSLRMSIAAFGRPVSAETRAKIGAANRGRVHTDATRTKNSLAKRGEKGSRAKLVEKDVLAVRALRAAGYTGSQVAAVFGVTKQSVDAIHHRQTWAHVPEKEADVSAIIVPPIHRLRGSSVGTAKLDEIRVAEIRRRLALGEKGTMLANEYGVTDTQISAIKHRRIWATAYMFE